MITKRDFILRSSCFCEKYIRLTTVKSIYQVEELGGRGKLLVRMEHGGKETRAERQEGLNIHL